MKKIISWLLFLIFIAVFIGFNTHQAQAVGKNFIGKKPPEIDISYSFNSRQSLSLADLKGKVVLVEFWATWCPPCRQAIAHLKELYTKYSSKGLVIIAITAEDKDTVKKFISENRMRFPVALDNSGKTNAAYGIKSIPTAYLIGADGVVLWQGHTMQLQAQKVESALEDVKAETTLPVW
jgi:peroxiredoxin